MALLQSSGPGVLFTGVAVVLVGLVIVLVSAVEIVEVYEKRAVTVRGEYRTLLTPGVNLVIPVVSETYSIDMRTQRTEMTVETTSRDWAAVSASARVDLKVTDAETAFLETDEYRQDTQEQVEAVLREFLGDLSAETLRGDRETLNERAHSALDERVEELGMAVVNVDIEDLTVDEDEDEW